MPRKKKDVEPPVIGCARPSVRWSIEDAKGLAYDATWNRDSITLTSGGALIGVVPLHKDSTKVEAEQIATYYLTRFRGSSGLGALRPAVGRK